MLEERDILPQTVCLLGCWAIKSRTAHSWSITSHKVSMKLGKQFKTKAIFRDRHTHKTDMSMKNWSLSFYLKFLSHFVQFTSWSLMNYFISYCVFLDANYKTTHNKPWVWWREKLRSNFSRTRKVRRW